MGLFSKKKLIDILKKDFIGRRINPKLEENVLSFEINFESGFNLYPYIKVNEVESTVSIKININKAEKITLNELNSLNSQSKYFKFLLSDSKILYLEYNAFVNSENIGDVCANVINSLNSLENALVEF